MTGKLGSTEAMAWRTCAMDRLACGLVKTTMSWRKSDPRLPCELNDSQVMYWEPAKYVAKMRTLKTDANPLLLKINMGAGHGGASGRYDYLREIALDYAFLLTQLGIRE